MARKRKLTLPPVEDKPVYCKPHNAGLYSETKAVQSRLGKLIDMLDSIDAWTVEGAIIEDCRELRRRLVTGLEGQGWKCSYNGIRNHMRIKG